MTWYLRTPREVDTHRGVLNPQTGMVAAACGITFTPLPLPLGGVSLPGHPPDRDQICPACARARR